MDMRGAFREGIHDGMESRVKAATGEVGEVGLEGRDHRRDLNRWVEVRRHSSWNSSWSASMTLRSMKCGMCAGTCAPTPTPKSPPKKMKKEK